MVCIVQCFGEIDVNFLVQLIESLRLEVGKGVGKNLEIIKVRL